MKPYINLIGPHGTSIIMARLCSVALLIMCCLAYKRQAEWKYHKTPQLIWGVTTKVSW